MYVTFKQSVSNHQEADSSVEGRLVTCIYGGTVHPSLNIEWETLVDWIGFAPEMLGEIYTHCTHMMFFWEPSFLSSQVTVTIV